MNIISIAVVAIVFIALCVVVYRASKAWHWVNVLFLMLTFVSGLAATIGLAQVGHLTEKQKSAAIKAQKTAEELTLQADRQVSGSFDSVSYEQDSLRGISQELSITMAGRGRVWSGGVVSADGDGVTFTFPKPRPAGENSAVKLTNVILFAFSEGMVPIPKGDDDGAEGPAPVVPLNYIGSVRVTEETPAMLKLAPEFISNPDEWAQPTAPWSLFEKMPLDRHETVHDAFRRRVGLEEDAEIDLTQLRQFLRQGLLTPERVQMDENSADYEALLDRYTFDGVPLGDIQNFVDGQQGRISNSFDPTPAEIFVRYEFMSKSKKSYQVDANGSLETDGPFTAGGLAIEPSLHIGKEVEFAEGDTVLVDLITATGYSRNEGTQVPPFPSTENVKEIERIFVRPLRDYPYMLATTTQKTEEAAEEIIRRQQSNAVQMATLQDTKTQQAERSQQTAMMEEDQENLKSDQQAIAEVLTKKQATVDQLRQKIDGHREQISQANGR